MAAFRDDRSLSDKLKEHYANRNFTVSKHTASKAGMAFVVTMLITLYLEGFFVLIPAHYSRGRGKFRQGYILSNVFSLWLLLMSSCHWWYTHYSKHDQVTKQTKEESHPNTEDVPPGWKRCPTCMLDAPPRSHHCSLCNQCILKRDHHCFFTGSCVGYHNQRHFVIFCVFAMLSCSYALYMQVAYLNKFHPVLSKSAVVYFPLVTIVKFLFKTVTFSHLCLILHLWLAILALGMSAFFLSWQLLIILRGQTSFEAWKRIVIYRRQSIFTNIHDVFGNPLHFIIMFFIPIRFKMPGNGTKFVIEPKVVKGH